MNEDERKRQFERAQRMRNLAIAGVLLFLVVLFFYMTIVRLGGQVIEGG